MNLNKQDFVVALVAIGLSDNLLVEQEKTAAYFVGQYATSPKDQQKEYLEAVKVAASKSITMLQQLNEKLDDELAIIEGGK